MDTWNPLSLSLLIVLAGCSSFRTVDFTGRSVMPHEITTRKGERSYGSNLVHTADSIVWTDHTGRQRALANSEIRGVRPMPGRASARTWVESLEDINKLAQTKRARVVLSDGTEYSANQLHVARDTATWFDPRTRRLHSIPTMSIASVHFRDGKRGTLRGLAGGAAAGVLSGLAIGFASGDDPADQFFAFTAAEKAVALGVVFGVLGAPVGAVVGSGRKISYRFDAATIPPESPDLTLLSTEPIVSPQPEEVDPQMTPPPERALWDTQPTPEDASPDTQRAHKDSVSSTERPSEHAAQSALLGWSVSALGAGVMGGRSARTRGRNADHGVR